jgi:hypothetical protein
MQAGTRLVAQASILCENYKPMFLKFILAMPSSSAYSETIGE